MIGHTNRIALMFDISCAGCYAQGASLLKVQPNFVNGLFLDLGCFDSGFDCLSLALKLLAAFLHNQQFLAQMGLLATHGPGRRVEDALLLDQLNLMVACQ